MIAAQFVVRAVSKARAALRDIFGTLAGSRTHLLAVRHAFAFRIVLGRPNFTKSSNVPVSNSKGVTADAGAKTACILFAFLVGDYMIVVFEVNGGRGGGEEVAVDTVATSHLQPLQSQSPSPLSRSAQVTPGWSCRILSHDRRKHVLGHMGFSVVSCVTVVWPALCLVVCAKVVALSAAAVVVVLDLINA